MIAQNRRIAASLLAFTLLVPLGGCAAVDQSAFPSLAQRAVERQASAAPSQPATPPVPAPVTATLDEAIRGLAADANGGEAAFRTALAGNRDVVLAGRGAALGSEGWAVAQRALSRIDAARGPTLIALAELDRLVVTQADAGNSSAVSTLSAEQGRVAALADAQRGLLQALGAGLAQ